MIAPALELNTAARKEIVCELDPSIRIPPEDGESAEDWQIRYMRTYADYLRTGDETLLRLDGKETRFCIRPLSRSELRFIELDNTHWVANKGKLAYIKETRAKAFQTACVEAWDTVDGERKHLDLKSIPFLVQEEVGAIIWNWSTQVDGPFAVRSSLSSGGGQGSSTPSPTTPKRAAKAGPKKTSTASRSRRSKSG